jgi:hypothetical protein
VLDQLGLPDDAATMVHEIRQETELVARELDRHAIDGHTGARHVQRQRPASQLGRRVPRRAPDERADAGNDFFDMKWFRDVIVRAGVDPLHLLVPAAARRQHEHRHRQTGASPAIEQTEAVDARQAEIEHDGVVALGLREKVAALAIRRDVHGVAGFAERRCHMLSQTRLVFDDQHSHTLRVCTAARMNVA